MTTRISPLAEATKLKRGRGPRRKAVSIESVYVADQGTPGFRHVPTDRLPAQRFHTAGGAARSVLKAMKSNVAPEAVELSFVLHTDTGAGFRVHVNCEHDDVSVAHQGHSDMANDFLDDVGRETGWPNVAAALDALQKAVKDGVLAGEALEERVRSEYIPVCGSGRNAFGSGTSGTGRSTSRWPRRWRRPRSSWP